MLTLYGETFPSRLLLGTAAYPTPEILKQSVRTARPAMITVSLRRAGSGGEAHGQGFWSLLQETGVPVLPNTAGCQSVQEAVTTAQMAREVFETDWIKLELIGDDDTLQPDVFQLVEAAEILIKDGFKVLPYCTEDLIACRRLLDAGCQALMPWAAPIGTGLGAVHAYALNVLRERLPDTPLIIDAGLGLPSQAAQVMEWGFDGVLLNTAVSRSGDPVNMARAFALAVESGRLAFEAGPVEARDKAQASTPTVGQPFWHSAEY
ncbi:thiazole synthase [Neisseria meningitidis]|uniref:thiazole synthase n=1 Tax=Neisseria meningitidis TaxID=487 RepID=UPI00051D8172|nr:thiazole synthase [Neisseria meningitidis]KGI99063.1 thiazole synthase [Neisseria meningitidis]MBW3862870.1 thiazole synthase [Neisseria meningitidis]MBW3885515.1 thiazole synthase [Neisseria meningitidis]MBW3893482.1 thiazole synthase [Neisseria meningitidis]MBW3901510.1 thiazole synthase [Neisseria meningitidis]